MSTQKGNTTRTRPQKHKNVTTFRNNLHDTSKKVKLINSMQFNNVCTKCKSILEWKVKYKKYKPLKVAKTCVKCNGKTIKEAYHTLCGTCAKDNHVCPKCGKNFSECSVEVETNISKKINDISLENEPKKLATTKKPSTESSDDSYERESSSDFENDSESLLSTDSNDNVSAKK